MHPVCMGQAGAQNDCQQCCSRSGDAWGLLRVLEPRGQLLGLGCEERTGGPQAGGCEAEPTQVFRCPLVLRSITQQTSGS